MQTEPENLETVQHPDWSDKTILIVEDVYNNFLLMDLSLPVLDGFEATSWIKAFKPWLPIIAVSAYKMDEEYASCLEAGCDAFIRKPLNTTLLMDTMKKLFHQYDKDK